MMRNIPSIQEQASPRRLTVLPQEMLVNDSRAGLTPSQMVERKLATMLRSTILPASHLQATRMRRALS
jgi:hypothetical protein